MDGDYYPTEEELERIRSWDVIDETGAKREACLDWIGENCWHLAEWGWKKEGKVYHVSTGGWSGNEDVIHAMKDNFLLWSMCWCETRRGGHYLFEVEPGAAEGMHA